MFILPNIELVKTSELYYRHANLSWSFGGNSSVICLYSSTNKGMSTEHWITDCSDVFSFDENKNLLSMELSVPNKNKMPSLNINEDISGRLVLHERIYTINQVTERFFDPVERKLFCFNEMSDTNRQVSLIKMHDDFSLILLDGLYLGYVLNNPLGYLTNDIYGHADSSLPTDDEYQLMSEFLYIMSDNRLEELNDDMELVVNELKNKIGSRIKIIKSEHRKNILKTSLDELLYFYS
ncbi:hypothetical protein OO184_20380 [Photorhabdus sp. APURE]|uniref:hypothetical protein n=1 Tax=Photorhabdus aballayi TaxID=2991723 RepID=UPI00223E7229|nr:hypothetical protein [Photorhabdus aballayi]MCW7550223.1 hypothetical protein [Photorhabdus aballayi]